MLVGGGMKTLHRKIQGTTWWAVVYQKRATSKHWQKKALENMLMYGSVVVMVRGKKITVIE